MRAPTSRIAGARARLTRMRARHLTLRRVVTVLALSLLGTGLLVSQPVPLTIQTLPTGRWPGALVLDRSAAPAVVANDGDGTLSLLDLPHGHMLRTVPVADPRTLAPLAVAPDPRTHHLFVASRTDFPAPSVVQMLDSRSGAHLATTLVGQEAAALTVDVRHEEVLVADETDGTLSLLDARTGALQRTLPLGLLPLALAVDADHNRAFVIGSAEVGDVALPAWGNGGVGGRLAVLDLRTNALLQRTPLGDGPIALVVDARSARVFVACTGDHTVRVLDARSGTPLRTVTLDAAPAALAVDDRRGRIYAMSTAGMLSLLDARSGQLLRTRHIDPNANVTSALPYALAVDAARDRVYLSTYGPTESGPQGLTVRGNGTLDVLDARTGAVQGRIAVGVAPQAVAVEEGSGRVVVVNRGGVVARTPDGWSAPWIGRLRAWLPWLDRIAKPAPSLTRRPGSVSVLSPTEQ